MTALISILGFLTVHQGTIVKIINLVISAAALAKSGEEKQKLVFDEARLVVPATLLSDSQLTDAIEGLFRLLRTLHVIKGDPASVAPVIVGVSTPSAPVA